MMWLKLLIPAAIVVGVAVVVGGKKCTVLDSVEKANRWSKRNENRTPDRFVMVGFWEPSWRDTFCDDPVVETIALDFQKLVGQQLDILTQQGLETGFPDENIVVGFRKRPSPQIYFAGGDGLEEAAARRIDIDRFLAGEIEGQPVDLPGSGTATRSTSAATTVAELFRVLRG